MGKRNKLPKLSFADRAEKALNEAVLEVMAENRRLGYPIAIWEKGRVVHLPADQIEVREAQAKYRISPRKRK
jgi:hypothetical protein